MIRRAPTELRKGRQNVIPETLSDYGEVPLRIREQILTQRNSASLTGGFRWPGRYIP